jgi:hypothetical protein
LHINKGRLHAFRKLAAQQLPQEDCHHKLRTNLLAEVNFKVQPTAISIAWDWNFMGSSKEGIENEITYCKNATTLNGHLKRPSLATPDLCILRWIQALCSDCNKTETISENGCTNSQNIINRLGGLYSQMKALLKKEIATFSIVSNNKNNKKLHQFHTSDEADLKFDPDSSDYSCKLCFKELPNTYYNCNGCNNILHKDYNICNSCYSREAYMVFTKMNESTFIPLHSSHHHLGKIHENSKHNLHNICQCCQNCSCCKCDCHHHFTLRYRYFNKNQLEKMLIDIVMINNNLKPHVVKNNETPL